MTIPPDIAVSYVLNGDLQTFTHDAFAITPDTDGCLPTLVFVGPSIPTSPNMTGFLLYHSSSRTFTLQSSVINPLALNQGLAGVYPMTIECFDKFNSPTSFGLTTITLTLLLDPCIAANATVLVPVVPSQEYLLNGLTYSFDYDDLRITSAVCTGFTEIVTIDPAITAIVSHSGNTFTVTSAD